MIKIEFNIEYVPEVRLWRMTWPDGRVSNLPSRKKVFNKFLYLLSLQNPGDKFTLGASWEKNGAKQEA